MTCQESLDLGDAGSTVGTSAQTSPDLTGIHEPMLPDCPFDRISTHCVAGADQRARVFTLDDGARRQQRHPMVCLEFFYRKEPGQQTAIG
jgi:hypothetical protein